MNGLILTLASSDPLGHVLDHDLMWLTSNMQITKHVLFLMLSAVLCMLIFPMVAGKPGPADRLLPSWLRLPLQLECPATRLLALLAPVPARC